MLLWQHGKHDYENAHVSQIDKRGNGKCFKFFRLPETLKWQTAKKGGRRIKHNDLIILPNL